MQKLLFIRYKRSNTILEGGEQASQKNFNLLSKLLGEEAVHTYYMHDERKKKTSLDYLKGLWFFLQGYFFGLSPRRLRELVTLAQDFDIVFIDRSVFGLLAKKLKEQGYQGQVITFFHNVEKYYFEASIPSHHIWKPIVLRCVDKNDRMACNYSDKIIALNQRDADSLERLYQRKADQLIPIAFKDVYHQESYSKDLTRVPPVCLFVGTYFSANAQGIQWFIKEVYPHVSVRLVVVGKNMKLLSKDIYVEKGIEIISDAPSLAPYFEEADLVVLPIFTGSGMKVKTCEALMYGKNILASTESFEGYQLNYKQVGGLCNTKEEYIAHINDFIAHPRPRFNTYSRQVFLEKYSEEAVEDTFKQLLALN